MGLALKFHAAGSRVIIGGRRTALLAQIAAEHPGIDTVVIDTADPVSITTAAADVLTRFPHVNVLVAMAGIMEPEDIHTDGFLSVPSGRSPPICSARSGCSPPSPSPRRPAGRGDHHRVLRIGVRPAAVHPTYNATKAAIHLLSRGIRVQLADTSIQVIKLIPPAVRTALMGQQNSEQAMSLAAYLDETMALLQHRPDADEIVVEGVKFLRDAETNGNYDHVLALLSGH